MKGAKNILRARVRAVAEAVRRAAAKTAPLLAWMESNRRWAYALIAAALLLPLLFPQGVREHWKNVRAHLWPGDREGLILLETPQVFTRQRLVNDRAIEQAWLEGQLDRTRDLIAQGAFAKPDFIRFARRHFSMALNQAEKANAPPAAGDDIRKRLGALGLTPPPLDQFEDAVRYREAIRNALMTTALDDRHDIEGNTIYRLNFNVTVLPPKGGDRLAAAVVDVTESDPRASGTAPGDYIDLLYDWREKLREQAHRVLDDRVGSILMGQEFGDVEEGNHLKASLDRASQEALSEISGRQASPELLLELHRRYGIAAIDQHKEYVRTVFRSDPVLSQALAAASGRKKEDLLASALSECQYREEISLAPFRRPGAKMSRSERRSIPCEMAGPRTDFLSRATEIFGALRAVQSLKAAGQEAARCAAREADMIDLVSNAALPSPSATSSCARLGQELHERSHRIADAKRYAGILGPFVLTYMLSKGAKSERLGARDTRLTLGEFFKVELPEQCPADACRSTIAFARPQALGSAARTLMQILEGRVAVFTYAVMPNKAMIRSEAARRLSSDLAGQAGGGALAALIASMSSEAEISGFDRDPTIVGFGEWQTGAGSAPAGNSTRFGWAMFPRPKAEEGGYRVQVPENYSVSALVSLPGWWKSVHLRVRTCWISELDIETTADPLTVCPVSRSAKPDYHLDLRLPGEAQELMHNLRFDVLRYPHLYGMEDAPSIEIGRTAEIIVRGARLWRSPMVKLGGQKANRVEVLPDMNGIVARFDCILPQPGSPGTGPTFPTNGSPPPPKDRMLLQVITSEGMTRPVEIRTHDFVLRSSYVADGSVKPDRPCWAEEKNRKKE